MGKENILLQSYDISIMYSNVLYYTLFIRDAFKRHIYHTYENAYKIYKLMDTYF